MIRNSLVTLLLVAGCLWAPAVGAQRRGEGIAVHGHWAIEVRNADGTVAARREFSNALELGDQLLVHLLSRNSSVGRWAIWLESTNPPESVRSGPFGGGGGSVNAYIVEPAAATGLSYHFKTLSLDPASGAPVGKTALTLKGEAVPTGPGFLTQVHSAMSLCPGNVAAGTCQDTNNYIRFTGTRLKTLTGADAPLRFEAEQTLQVTVTLSFTSAAQAQVQ